MAELTDVTQALLGLRDENDENTEETRQMRKELFSLNKNITAFFLDEKRRMEGDGLEASREKSKSKAGGGINFDKLFGESGIKTANVGAGTITSIVALLTGIVFEFFVQLGEVLEFIKGTKLGRGITMVTRYLTMQFSFRGGIIGRIFAILDTIFDSIAGTFNRIGNTLKSIPKLISFGFNSKAFNDFAKSIRMGITPFQQFFISVGKLFRRIVRPFESAIKVVAASGVMEAGKGVSKVAQFFPAIGKVVRFLGTLTFTLGRSLLIPLQILVGLFSFFTGLYAGFTKKIKDGAGVVTALLSGTLEGLRRTFVALITQPLDLLLYVIGFLFDKFIKAITFGFFETNLRGFFDGLLTGLTNFFFSLFQKVFEVNPFKILFELADTIGGIFVGITKGIFAGFAALFTPGKSAFEAFQEEFQKSFEKAAGTNITSGEATIAGNPRRRQNLNENMVQQNLPTDQGGGVTLNDGSTVVNNQSDNSQALSLSTEEPFDNQDQMERYGRNRRRR